MSIEYIKNGNYLPHQAVVLAKTENIFDFKLEKIICPYEKRKSEKFEFPIWEVEVHPVDFCGLGCKGCSYAERHSGNTINLDKLISVINKYGQSDLRTVFFSGGGDPCGWKAWKDFISMIGDRKWVLGISTNLYDLSNIRDIIYEFDFFQIHVVGYNANSLYKEAGSSNFEQLVKNYEELFERKKDKQYVTLKILVRDQNYKEIKHYLDFIERFDCDAVVIKMEQDFINNRVVNEKIQFEEIRRLIMEHTIVNKYNYSLDNLEDIVFENPIPQQCYIANSGLYNLIRADGSIYPCVACTYDFNNAYDSINTFSGYNDKKVADGFYDKIMKAKKCPLNACRHYRFNGIIEKYIQGEFWEKQNREPQLL